MEKIWIKNYQKGVPPEINPDRYASLNAVFEESCRTYAKRPAFASFGRVITFQDLERKSKIFAAFLQNDLKMQKGDRIALMMPNLLQYPIALFGALAAGMVVVCVNPLYTARELQFQLEDSAAKTILVLENFAHTLELALEKTEIKNIIVTKIGDEFHFPKSLLANWFVKYIKKMEPPYSLPKFYSYKQAISLGSKQIFKRNQITGQDIAFLQYTGGTTGKPKGAILTHRNMVANLEQASAWVKPVLKVSGEIMITALPLYHIFSLMANCLTFMKHGGLNVLITNPRDLKPFIQEMKKYKFTAITGVNTLFNALLNQPEFKELDFSGLHIALGGGMSVQKVVAERWKKMTGVPLIEAYGLTEASPAVCINPLNLQDFNGSIGLPVSSTTVSIRNEAGEELGFDQPGELWVKGPQVMKGYWGQEAETAHAIKEGWLRTGDIATIDNLGFVRIVDRMKDMIVISGFNVYPTEIEEVISKLEGVSEVAVVGIVQAGKELVKAFIKKRNPELTAEEVLAHCRSQLTPYKVPKEVEFCEDLPKTNVGKILKRALRENQHCVS